MNLDQPSHQHNYTEIGFKKLKAPKAAWEPLLKFYGRYLIGDKSNFIPFLHIPFIASFKILCHLFIIYLSLIVIVTIRSLYVIEDNKDRGAHPEKWPRGNTYTNNWESPTHMISLEDQTLRGNALKGEILFLNEFISLS